MDTHENQCGLNADTPERALDDAAESLPEEELLYDLADLFKVFSDTTRIKILYALMNDEKSVNEIAENLGASQSAVSHQLRILKQAHLVKFRRDADLFKVFSDTTRIKILYALMNDEKSVNEIAENLGASQSAVSHQLRILKQAHLVKFRRDGRILKQAHLVKFRRDGRNIHYSLADDHVLTILDQGLTHICE